MPHDQATWQLWIDRPGALVSPFLFGHFAEHLGRCIYEGLWVGPESPIPNQDGLRTAVLAALRDLPVPVLRWPGGCFADDYHWEDGIGPRERRPRRTNLWRYGEEPNHFGTDEFLALCRAIGAEPYICLNVGSGSPTEARNWLEYCNGSGQTHYARLRAQHGHPEPYGVRYWGVGNENWGCGGHFTPEEYAAAYRRFATYLKPFTRTTRSRIELIACGHTTPDWNQRFLAALGVERNPRLLDLIDHLSIHRYFRGPHDRDFTAADYYWLLASTLQLETDLRRTRDVLSYDGGQKRLGIVVDEWGTWYDQARAENGLEQVNTMQDAVVAAGTLNLFVRWADWVTMANLAQTVNVLQCVVQTAGPAMWLTPTYHAVHLLAAHRGQRVLPADLETPELTVSGPAGTSARLPLVDGAASRSADGRTLVLTLVNRHLEEAIECRISLRGEGRIDGGLHQQLTADDIRAANSAADPERVRPTRAPFPAAGTTVAVTLPPHSVTALQLTLVSP